MIHRFLSKNTLLSYEQRVQRLGYFTLLFFIVLSVPVALTVYFGLQQIEQERLSQIKNQTSQYALSLNKRIFKRNALANGIAASQFNYIEHLYNPISRELTQAVSPLANINAYAEIPGLVGYFQIDRDKQFSSPVWPFIANSDKDSTAVAKGLNSDAVARRELMLQLREITLASNHLNNRLEAGLVNVIDRFRVYKDVPGYYIFYRVVRLNDDLVLQGYVFELESFLSSRILRVLEIVNLPFPVFISLTNNVEGKEITQDYFSSHPTDEGLVSLTRFTSADLYRENSPVDSHTLNWPFDSFTLVFASPHLPLSANLNNSTWLVLILAVFIIVGCYGFYRIGIKHLKLAEQRLNFVSAVSHELKTPLTSIRMYAEMLKEGQVLSEQHQQEYFEFIFSESERLSRLIENILQLAKLNQPHHSATPQFVKLNTLIDMIHSKTSSLLTKHEFSININVTDSEAENLALYTNQDAFLQIVINVVDNAIKFFDKEGIHDISRQKIDVTFGISKENSSQIFMSIRDYGDGISPEQEDKLFNLFYRGGSELTRATQGTGIGLALVRDLAISQQGFVKAQRKSPGLEIVVCFKCKIHSASNS